MAKKGRDGRRLLGAGVTVVALGAGAAHLIWPALKIDAITVLLLVVALLPWLGGLLESVELPGGYKLQYRALAAKVEQTDQRAAEAVSTANVAIGAARVDPTVSHTLAELDGLLAEYARLRALPSDASRTQLLDQLFGVMVTVVPKVAGFDVAAALAADAPAMRLAGYAYLFGQENPAYTDNLIDSLMRESTSFNQYWAIMALRGLVIRDPNALTGRQRTALRDLLAGLPAGSRQTRLAAVLGEPGA